MKNLKTIIRLVFVLFASFIITACADDEDIRFTKDEIIQGDINTGKQVSIPGNSISVYATMSKTVNVQNANGTISAVSKDKSIATVQVVSSSNGKEKSLVINGIQIGETQVVVSDTDGKTAILRVKVEDVNLFWKTVCTYKKTSLIEDEVVIEGVDETAAGKIRTDALVNKANETKFILKCGSYFPSNTYKMQVLDKDDKILYELVGCLVSDSNYRFNLVSQNQESDVKTYTFSEENNDRGKWLVEDISDDYKAQYPDVKVVVKMAVEKQ